MGEITKESVAQILHVWGIGIGRHHYFYIAKLVVMVIDEFCKFIVNLVVAELSLYWSWCSMYVWAEDISTDSTLLGSFEHTYVW